MIDVSNLKGSKDVMRDWTSFVGGAGFAAYLAGFSRPRPKLPPLKNRRLLSAWRRPRLRRRLRLCKGYRWRSCRWRPSWRRGGR